MAVHDIEAEEAQRFDVVVDGFAFDPDAAGGQLMNQARGV